MKKIMRWLSVCVFFLVALCPHALAKEAATPAGASPLTVAILPIQNEADPYFTLAENRSDISRLVDLVRERSGRAVPSFDARHRSRVQDMVSYHLGRMLLEKGYGLIAGRELLEFYRRLELRGKEVPYQELQKWVGADFFLVVNFQAWDAQDFDSQGSLRVSFSIHLIDPEQPAGKTVVWKKSSTDKVQLEESSFEYFKRQEELIRELSRTMMKNFPQKNSLVSNQQGKE